MSTPQISWKFPGGRGWSRQSPSVVFWEDNIIALEWIFSQDGARSHLRFVGELQPDGTFRGTTQGDHTGNWSFHPVSKMVEKLIQDETMKKDIQGWWIEDDQHDYNEDGEWVREKNPRW